MIGFLEGMAQKPEAKYKAKVHKHLPEYVYHQGMYTPFSAGTPDHWYSGIEGDLWVEYKWSNSMSQRLRLCNPEVKYPMLTHKQQSWLRNRYNEGRNVAVVFACPEGSFIFVALSWEQPLEKEVFLAKCVDVKDVAQWIEMRVSSKKHVKTKEVLPI